MLQKTSIFLHHCYKNRVLKRNFDLTQWFQLALLMQVVLSSFITSPLLKEAALCKEHNILVTEMQQTCPEQPNKVLHSLLAGCFAFASL